MMTNSEIRGLIEERINGPHAERNRAILVRRFIDGICFDPLAEEFDLSVRQVKNIVAKYRPKIFE
ncbi:MAG: hypothetical protein IJG87_06405 [Ruminococcus sp.]|nr:hypothetical protein [Ruminococcus sp.]